MRSIALAMALSSAACVVELGEEPLPYEIGPGFPDEPPVEPLADPVDECVFTPGPVEGWIAQDAVSLAFEAGAYWLFAYGPGPEGAEGNFSNLAATPETPERCLFEHGDALAIGLTEDEALLEEGGEQHVFLWPVSGFVADEIGYVYYRKIVTDQVAESSTAVGVGVAAIAHGGVATRLLPMRYEDEPTLLWKTSEAFWGRGAVVHEGLAYVYGCFFDIDTQPVCHVARVAPEQVANRDAYEYFTGETWSASSEEAAVVIRDSLASPAFNPVYGKYLHIGRSSIAVSDTPWGPFEKIDQPLIDRESWPGLQVRQHEAHQSADGRRLVVSHRLPDFATSSFLVNILAVELR